MNKPAIISLVLMIAISAFVIVQMLPDRTRRGRASDHSAPPIELTSTNADGEVFTVRLGAMRVNGTNVSVSPTNVKFTIVETNQ